MVWVSYTRSVVTAVGAVSTRQVVTSLIYADMVVLHETEVGCEAAVENSSRTHRSFGIENYDERAKNQCIG